MKKVVIAIVILAIIITAGILENVYVDSLFAKLDKKLDSLEGSIVQRDEEATAMIGELIDWWENQRKYAEIFLYSPDIRAFSVALGEAEGSLECKDYDNALSKVRSLKIMSKNIHNILDFNLSDIV